MKNKEPVLFGNGHDIYMMEDSAPVLDRGVLALSRSKDKANAFLELLQPLQGRLEGYCRRMLRKRDQVEDVLQTVVALAFSRFDRYAQAPNFKAWIFRFATFE